ncbi:Serine/threonine-protein kinase PrkC [Bremerella volcania]|uniref:Serine/threonine-protein kinase PrkC n=1 Tax=Bremerella volcania TaxID=2527984 RepID=A0A518CC92_9BACT|nr:protein kinase [Bremerella volcania]QDU76843.1 Serine/threonine-protein kinase PrkC [Bremerella volcania]
MAKVIAIGQPVNDSERQAIAHLRDHLPDTYTILHNFEIRRGNEIFEIDLAIIAPHAVYLVDVKGTNGNIDVYGSKWYPEGRQPFSSPLPKLRGHAKALSGLIGDSNHADPNLRKVYCDAAVILTAPTAHLSDSTGKDAPNTTTLAKSARFFQDNKRIPDRFLNNIKKYTGNTIKAIQGSAKPIQGPARYGSWVVSEKLGGTDHFSEFRAYNTYVGKSGGRVVLRVYSVDPYATDEEKAAELRRISNAYKALSSLPTHPAIQAARDFFPNEDEDRYVLVVEDMSGQALRLHIERPDMALTFDQKVRVAQDLLSGLVHAHAHNVIHRNICPSTILFGIDGQARLINFDHARGGNERTSTIASEIVDDLESDYQPLECRSEAGGHPSQASTASDVFSLGIVLYELFTGERPFGNASEMMDQSCVFSVVASKHQPDLPDGFDEWLQAMCAFNKDKRPSAKEALTELEKILAPPSDSGDGEPPSTEEPETGGEDSDDSIVNFKDLPAGYDLTKQYKVLEKLGSGGFGVVYKVFDSLRERPIVVKIILPGRYSSIEKVKQETMLLDQLPQHRYVVKVITPGFLAGDLPFIAFDFVEGYDVGGLIENHALQRGDAWEMGKQVVEGLAHLHKHNVYHCDIKPRNLLWTSEGVKIIDFNVSVDVSEETEQHGGTRKYLPPDYELGVEPTRTDLQDRDLYAFGVTLYQAITGKYPWNASTPPRGTMAQDPRSYAQSTCGDLPQPVVEFLWKVIHPERHERFQSADDILKAMQAISSLRMTAPEETEGTITWKVPSTLDSAAKPNTNPFVDVLLTLYSQGRNNKGTRGLTLDGEIYVETALDRELIPASLDGEFRLVIITGNAGDGKTAFLQKLEQQAKSDGATVTPAPRGNGATFELKGRKFRSNYDGSQDEGDVTNEAVLTEFLEPFQGDDASAWPTDETRLIAINEGRLVDFLESHAEDYPHLLTLVRQGLESGVPDDGIAMVNLNLRSVVANSSDGQPSILERLLKRMTHKKFWKRCDSCDLRERCYVLHNVKTFQDDTAGPLVTERLKTLYTLSDLRGRQHVTLRDLGSSLSFMIAGTRNCEEIHELYASGNPREIANSFYFNSWMGGESGSADRLLSLLAEIDVGKATDPRLDRALDFQSPDQLKGLLGFDQRGQYDTEIFSRLYNDLPWNHSGQASRDRFFTHQSYVSMAKRRHYFERIDDSWRRMLPYQSAGQMLQVVRGEVPPEDVLQSLIRAINLGEGLTNPERMKGKLVLQVRDVPNGAMRSYRLFPAERFQLQVDDSASRARFVEHMPTSLILSFHSEAGLVASLDVNLDVFEMLYRLNHGYRPTVEELQGYYLSLAIFKNLLSSAPYQEVLLTTTGHDFFRVEREESGRLNLEHVGTEV